jgi:hypothetical protein
MNWVFSRKLRETGAAMNKRSTLALYSLIGIILFPSPAAAQAESKWGLDYEGRAITAVLPLVSPEGAPEGEGAPGAGRDMALRFRQAVIDAVLGLEKYSPLRVDGVAEIPTDMPPNRDLAAGARYALTGGVYPGGRAGEYYLQLWLWDMAGSTMIYTDDLVYDDMDDALLSLPGLVEWLFSHIRELAVETPEPVSLWDPLLMIGLRAGASPRWYTASDEGSPGAWALSFEGGLSAALRLNSLFALQAEIVFTRDTLVYRGFNADSVLFNVKYTMYSLMFPVLLRANFRPGAFRISPLAGFYVIAPLGHAGYRLSTEADGRSYSWSFSVPLGFTAGLEAAVPYGPGLLFAGLRYAGDFGVMRVDHGLDAGYRMSGSARRNIFSVFMGYEFGFFNKGR